MRISSSDNSGVLSSQNWKNVWNRRGNGLTKEFTLEELISLDGFDSGCGRHSTDSWLAMTRWLVNLLEISDKDEHAHLSTSQYISHSGSMVFRIRP